MANVARQPLYILYTTSIQTLYDLYTDSVRPLYRLLLRQSILSSHGSISYSQTNVSFSKSRWNASRMQLSVPPRGTKSHILLSTISGSEKNSSFSLQRLVDYFCSKASGLFNQWQKDFMILVHLITYFWTTFQAKLEFV